MNRSTRIFSDIDLNFLPSPLTRDVTKKFDVNSIKQSIKNLVMTNHYEKPFHPELGSPVMSLLFEPQTHIIRHSIETAIAYTITNFEPRVRLMGVRVSFDENNDTINVEVEFRIVNTETPITVDFTLKRTR